MKISSIIIGFIILIGSVYFYGYGMELLISGYAIGRFWVLPTILIIWMGLSLTGLFLVYLSFQVNVEAGGIESYPPLPNNKGKEG